jgi:hypothetical protein
VADPHQVQVRWPGPIPPCCLLVAQMQLGGGWDKGAQMAGQKRLANGMMVGGGSMGMGMVPNGMMGAMGGGMMAVDNKRPKVEGDKSILAKVGAAAAQGRGRAAWLRPTAVGPAWAWSRRKPSGRVPQRSTGAAGPSLA